MTSESSKSSSAFNEAFAAYAEEVGIDYATPEGFREAYCGKWASEREYAEEIFSEYYAHKLPYHLLGYIDYDAYARDLFTDDYLSVRRGGCVHVFCRF